MTRSEAGKLGAIASKSFFENLKKINRENYLLNPIYCLQCNDIIPFEKRKKYKFCNHSCAAGFNNKLYQKRIPGKYSKNKTCLNCDEKLNVEFNKLYCNRICLEMFRINQWISGKISGTIYTGTASWVKKYLRTIHENKCQLCGWNKINLKSGVIPLQIDHIDGNYLNNNFDNLQLICPNCHSLTPNFGALNKGSGRPYRYTISTN